jgi:hypothetical protein
MTYKISSILPNPDNKDNIWKGMTLGFPTELVQRVSRTLAFESRLMLLDVFKVDVLEILRQLILYAMIDKPETSKRTN